MKWLVIFLSSFLLMFSCKSKQVVKKSEGKACVGIRMDADEYMAADNSGIKILEASIDGNCLHIRYEIKDACESSDLDLHWDYRVKKSLPPEASLRLNKTGDYSCGLKVSANKSFDLKELMNPAYKGKIYLRLAPYQEKILFEYGTQQ